MFIGILLVLCFLLVFKEGLLNFGLLLNFGIKLFDFDFVVVLYLFDG